MFLQKYISKKILKLFFIVQTPKKILKSFFIVQTIHDVKVSN